MAISKKNLIYIIIGALIAGILFFSFLSISQPQIPPGEKEYREAPEKAQSLLQEAESLFDEGKYQEALEKYQEFLDQYPNSDRADNALLMIGRSQMLLGADDGALLTFQNLIENYPKSNNIPDALCHSARIYSIKGNFEKAEEYCDKILMEYPNLTGSQQWIIEASQKLKSEIQNQKLSQ